MTTPDSSPSGSYKKLDDLLLDLSTENLSDTESNSKIQEGCEIISHLKRNGAVIPTSAGVNAVDACASTFACSRVSRVLISSLDSNYLVKVATCTRTNTTATLVSSLVTVLRSSFFPSNEVSEDDQALERKCIYKFLQKIVKFRSFEQSVSLQVRSALSSAAGLESSSGNQGNEISAALDAAFKAWDGTVGDVEGVEDVELDKGKHLELGKIEDGKKDTHGTVPDYSGGTPIADEGLVTAMPVSDDVYSPPSTYAKEVMMKDKVPFHKRSTFKLFAFGTISLAIILATVISLVIIKPWEKSEGTDKPTGAPSSAVTSKKDFSWVDSVIYNKVNFENDPSLQAAFDWIKDEDEKQLEWNDPSVQRRYALASFYFATGGDTHWSNCTRKVNSTCDDEDKKPFLSVHDECDWFGITCEDGEVNEIKLDYKNLNGTLPSTISLLKNLNILLLVGNSLYGTLPDTIGELSDMTEFQCGENYFDGTIPDAVYDIQSMETISFYQNYFSGTIPNKIGKMRNLKGFWLFDNELSGTIPESIGNLGFLTYFDVKNNFLTGVVPDSFWALKDLEYVDISANILSPWTLPEDFGSQSIGYLNVGTSMLQKSLPDTFYKLQRLKTFLAENNDITGTISNAVGEMVGMEMFDVSYNRIGGTIPSSFTELENLNILILRGNEFTGKIPAEFDNFPNYMKYLFIQYNKGLSGEISEETCNNTGLIIADCLDTYQDPQVNCTCCAYCCDSGETVCTLM